MPSMNRLLPFLLLCSVAACQGGSSGDPSDENPTDENPTDENPTDENPVDEPSEWDKALESRKVNYPMALRVAAFRLVGRAPTLAEIQELAAAAEADKKTTYETLLDGYLADPAFTTQMRDFFRDSFKMGGAGLDTAPNFAAKLTVEDGNYMDLFTATQGNCPTLNGTTFTAANCGGNSPAQAGVLTDPAVQRHFYSNMAFRRVRWVQETFACTKFPAEFAEPTDVGGAAKYTAPWPFESIAGADNGGTVDFHDVSSVVCANCHATMNHQAPLFARYDAMGNYNANIIVPTPNQGMPVARLSDYLPAGETTAWRYNEPAADMPAFGASMAADPAVAECAVARVWNWALGKGDIVASLALVPTEVIEKQIADFTASGNKLKTVIRSVFTSDDFVKF